MSTTDPFSANLHLVPLGVVTSDRLKEYIGRWNGHWAKAIAFHPTGGRTSHISSRLICPNIVLAHSYSPPTVTSTTSLIASILVHQPHRGLIYMHLRPAHGSTHNGQFFGVPYSEHSSFFKLTCFALSLYWTRIVAMVNFESAGGKRSPGVVPYCTLE